MLPLKNRIKKEKEFAIVFSKGSTLFSGPAILKIFKNKTGETRFGFAVSKKISSNAAVRNKIKRRL